MVKKVVKKANKKTPKVAAPKPALKKAKTKSRASKVKAKTKAAVDAPAPEPQPEAPVASPHRIVTAPCKRGSDMATRNQACNSRTAYQTSKPGAGFISYQCTKCGHTWSITTGGAFNYF